MVHILCSTQKYNGVAVENSNLVNEMSSSGVCTFHCVILKL